MNNTGNNFTTFNYPDYSFTPDERSRQYPSLQSIERPYGYSSAVQPLQSQSFSSRPPSSHGAQESFSQRTPLQFPPRAQPPFTPSHFQYYRPDQNFYSQSNQKMQTPSNEQHMYEMTHNSFTHLRENEYRENEHVSVDLSGNPRNNQNTSTLHDSMDHSNLSDQCKLHEKVVYKILKHLFCSI